MHANEIFKIVFNHGEEEIIDEEVYINFKTTLRTFIDDNSSLFKKYNDKELTQILNTIPSFLDYCEQSQVLPKEKTIKEYFDNFKKRMETINNDPAYLEQFKTPSKNYAAQAISSEDLKDLSPDALENPSERIKAFENIINKKKKEESSEHKIITQPFDDQEKKVTAQSTWRKLIREIRNNNRIDRKTHPTMRKDIITHLEKMFPQNTLTEEELNQILEFTISMLQIHSSIVWVFSPNILSLEDFRDYRILSSESFASDRGGNYLNNRAKQEEKLFERGKVSKELMKEFANNPSARPRYASLNLPAAGMVPGLTKITKGYGEGYAIMNDMVKMESSFFPGDTLSKADRNIPLATIYDFETMFHASLQNPLTQSMLNTFVNWALFGDEAEGSGVLNDYVEAHLPPINLLNSAHVSNYFVPNDKYKFDKETLELFTDLNIQVDTVNATPSQEIIEEFFYLVKMFTPTEKDINQLQKIIKDYPFLPRLLDDASNRNVRQMANNEKIDQILKQSLLCDNGRQLHYYEKDELKNPAIMISYAFFDLIKNPNADILEIQKLIKSYPFLPKLRDINNKSTIELAAASGNLDTLKILLPELMGNISKETKLNTYDKVMLAKTFYAACKGQNQTVINFLLKLRPDVVHFPLCYEVDRSLHSFSLVTKAAQDNDINTYKLLIKNGAHDDLKGLDLNELAKRLQNGEFSFDELDFIQEWAKFSKQHSILKDVAQALEYLKHSDSTLAECKEERSKIMDKILSGASSSEIKELFENAKYSAINGFFKEGMGFLTGVLTQTTLSTDKAIKAIENLIEAGADPHYKRNDRDAFMELSSSGEKKHNFGLFNSSSPTEILNNVCKNNNAKHQNLKY